LTLMRKDRLLITTMLIFRLLQLFFNELESIYVASVQEREKSDCLDYKAFVDRLSEVRLNFHTYSKMSKYRLNFVALPVLRKRNHNICDNVVYLGLSCFSSVKIGFKNIGNVFLCTTNSAFVMRVSFFSYFLLFKYPFMFLE